MYRATELDLNTVFYPIIIVENYLESGCFGGVNKWSVKYRLSIRGQNQCQRSSSVGPANIRWTMPKSSGGPDHDMGAIEAVVKETARGRAFLAYYAKKVCQSDTLTMLAMIGRLERWCQDHAAGLTELEGHDLAFGDRAPEGHANLALDLNGESSGEYWTRRSMQITVRLPLSEQMNKRSAT